MTYKLSVPVVITGTFFLVCPAKAEDVPGETTAFVSYCADHFVDCRNEVRSANNINLMTQMGLMKGEHACIFPKTEPPGGRTQTREEAVSDSAAATKAVLTWLNANSATRKPKTMDAINQAIRVLWPANCK
jgi:hypothetical protein